ncbi:MAG: PEP-CTERM sorting domain-containing protein [Candidatus Omnitrophica bacterium]|nr:PEP-CTERM sorting domain-containing protein [Candidatus Omnitrophota bacterium]
MKNNMRSWTKTLAILLASISLGVIGQAQQPQVVYDNSTTYLGDFYAPSSLGEFGDQVKLSDAFASPTVTEFKFDYFLSHGANGNETADLKFYSNDGPNVFGGTTPPVTPAPGTLLYDSGVFPIAAGFNTFTASGLSLNVPQDFTWSVTFGGVEGTEQVGLLFYNPPTVGSSFDDFWDKSSGQWELKDFAGSPVANFGARVTAVPEPSTIQFAFMAGLAWCGWLAYRRRSSHS